MYGQSGTVALENLIYLPAPGIFNEEMSTAGITSTSVYVSPVLKRANMKHMNYFVPFLL